MSQADTLDPFAIAVELARRTNIPFSWCLGAFLTLATCSEVLQDIIGTDQPIYSLRNAESTKILYSGWSSLLILLGPLLQEYGEQP